MTEPRKMDAAGEHGLLRLIMAERTADGSVAVAVCT